jgi:uncharacterized lipoprotein YddW (UPF0748 family)
MKLFYHKDPSKALCYYNTDIQIEIPEVYIEKELRAMWVASVANIDLKPFEDETTYKKALIDILEVAGSYNLNAIFFQVRPANDALYESKLNPYSRYVMGKEGVKPSFDILKFFIDEASIRNIDIHAWCNPYRVSLNGLIKRDDYLKTCDPLNLAVRRPDLCILNKEGQIILNPAKKEVRTHIIESMLELVRNYDVKGIHFDDYFYPYQGLDDTYNDLKDYEALNQGESLDDFRRHQVTTVIHELHQALKKENPELMFGVSPFGIWKNSKRDPKGANVSEKATQSYDNQYADSYKWVKEGMIDYIVPQLYWEFGHPLAPFGDLAKWWIELCKDTNVKLYIGHGAYRLGNEGEYENPLEVCNQVKFVNQSPVVKGNVFFTYKTFINDDKNKPGMAKLKSLLNGALHE